MMQHPKAAARVGLDADVRIATGIPGFDEMLEGGFPAGSLISLAGRPGTGKTIFGSQFLFYGAKELKEPGMYVSMLEGRKAYVRNMMRLGFDIQPLESKGLFRFLEMPTLTSEGMPAIWDEIVRNIDEHGVVRLVLRVFTHMLLGKIVGGAGCTTLMITVTAHTDVLSSVGIQEFVADGVIHFSLVPITGDARVRYIEITKMRGTNHQMGLLPVEIGNRGISVKVPHITAR